MEPAADNSLQIPDDRDRQCRRQASIQEPYSVDTCANDFIIFREYIWQPTAQHFQQMAAITCVTETTSRKSQNECVSNSVVNTIIKHYV